MKNWFTKKFMFILIVVIAISVCVGVIVAKVSNKNTGQKDIEMTQEQNEKLFEVVEEAEDNGRIVSDLNGTRMGDSWNFIADSLSGEGSVKIVVNNGVEGSVVFESPEDYITTDAGYFESLEEDTVYCSSLTRTTPALQAVWKGSLVTEYGYSEITLDGSVEYTGQFIFNSEDSILFKQVSGGGTALILSNPGTVLTWEGETVTTLEDGFTVKINGSEYYCIATWTECKDYNDSTTYYLTFYHRDLGEVVQLCRNTVYAKDWYISKEYITCTDND